MRVANRKRGVEPSAQTPPILSVIKVSLMKLFGCGAKRPTPSVHQQKKQQKKHVVSSLHISSRAFYNKNNKYKNVLAVRKKAVFLLWLSVTCWKKVRNTRSALEESFLTERGFSLEPANENLPHVQTKEMEEHKIGLLLFIILRFLFSV